eukprot:scaffold11050_cov34-Attheya_sp.AAC.1
MKFTQFFGPYGVALAVLFLFSNVQCVLSNKKGEGVGKSIFFLFAKELRESTEKFKTMVNDNDQETKQGSNDGALLDCNIKDIKCLSGRASTEEVEGVLSKTIEMETKQLAEESRESTEKFKRMVNDINQETKQDINDVALLDCNLKNKKCLSRRAKRVLKIEANLRKTIAHLKNDREKFLTNRKRVVDTKMKEADDILGYESSVRTKDKSHVSMIDSLVKQEDSMRNTLSEADKYLKLSQKSVSTEAECDFYGLNYDDLSDREWETLMDTFKAIVNLAY